MKLLDQVRHAARVKHFSYRTEQTYVHWVERYVRFHGIRHPKELGTTEVEQFLTHLAVAGNVAASTQNRAPRPVGTRQTAVCSEGGKHVPRL